MYVNQSVFILFYVKRKKMTGDGKAPLYVRLTIDGLHEEMSLAIKIHPDHWDNAKKIVLPADPAHNAFNKKLSQVKVDLERHFDLVQAQQEIATPQAVFTAYKMPRRGVKVKEEKIRNLAFSESLNKLIGEYLGYHSKYIDAHMHGRTPAQPRKELLEREKKRLDQAIEKMAKGAMIIFDDKSWTKTLMLAVDEHLLNFLQLSVGGAPFS